MNNEEIKVSRKVTHSKKSNIKWLIAGVTVIAILAGAVVFNSTAAKADVKKENFTQTHESATSTVQVATKAVTKEAPKQVEKKVEVVATTASAPKQEVQVSVKKQAPVQNTVQVPVKETVSAPVKESVQTQSVAVQIQPTSGHFNWNSEDYSCDANVFAPMVTGGAEMIYVGTKNPADQVDVIVEDGNKNVVATAHKGSESQEQEVDLKNLKVGSYTIYLVYNGVKTEVNAFVVN